jgi:transposase
VLLRAELFVAVAGESSYLYAAAFPSQELLYWVTGHVHAFEFMGGCPAIVVRDYVARNIIPPDYWRAAGLRAGGGTRRACDGGSPRPARPVLRCVGSHGR